MERIPARRLNRHPVIADFARQNAIPALIWTIIENRAEILHVIRFLCITLPRFVFNVVSSLLNYIVAQVRTFGEQQYLNTHPAPTMTQPPVVPGQAAPNTRHSPPKTPTMPDDIYELLSTDLANETWTVGRDVIVNKTSNTISVFEVRDTDANSTVITDEIPLRYRDVPVIPHCFPRMGGLPLPFDYPSNDTLVDGLSEQDIRTLHKILPGILAIDFHFDRQVFITMTGFGLEEAFAKYRTVVLEAFGCVLILGLAAPNDVPFKGFTDYDSAESHKPLVPGAEMFNKFAEYSSVGVLLLPRGHGPQKDLKYFTLSAHSFIRKRHIYDFNIFSALVLTFITHIAYSAATRQFFSLLFLKSWLFIRLYILLWDTLTKYRGKSLGIHRLNGQVTMIRLIPNLLMTMIFILPLFGRMVTCSYLEMFVGIPSDIVLLRVPWKVLVELIFTIPYLITLIRIIRGFNVKIEKDEEGDENEWLQSEMLVSWMNVSVRSMCGARDVSTFPYELCLVFMGFCRLVTNYTNIVHEEWCRFAATFILGWDIIELIWELDWPITNVQLGEKVYKSDGSIIGEVYEMYDKKASRVRPHLCRNDVAVGELMNPLPNTGYRILQWSDRYPDRNTTFFLLGKQKYGRYEGDKGLIIENPLKVQLGGFRFLYGASSHGHGVAYGSRGFIWRSKEITITGSSGSALVAGGDLCDPVAKEPIWTVYGFQSHEIKYSDNPGQERPKYHFKIAYLPPKKLREKYLPLAPSEMMGKLDYQKDGKPWLLGRDFSGY